MTKLSFNFPHLFYQNLLNQKISVVDFIHEVLATLDTKGNPNIKNLTFNLRFNHAAEGGSPEIVDLEVFAASYNTETQKGHVTLSYRVERHYTCSDVKSQQKHTEVCPFDINLIEGVMLLQIPEDESRNTVFEL